MVKLKPTKYKEFAQKLIRAGYIAIRKTKHIVYYHPEKQITIPLPHKHRGDIPTGLLNKLLKEMKVSKEEFDKL